MFNVRIIFLVLTASLHFSTILNVSFACKDVKFNKPINEKASEGKWYLFASSTPCDNCCFVRNIQVPTRGVFSVTDYIKKPSDAAPKIKRYIVKRNQNIFTVGNNTKPITAMDVDTSEHAIFYNEIEDAVQIFTRDTKYEDTFLESFHVLSKCNFKIHKYNPEVCKN